MAQLCDVSRAAQDEFALRSQNNAEAALLRGFWERDITPVRLPDGTVVSADDGPPTTVRARASSWRSWQARPRCSVSTGP